MENEGEVKRQAIKKMFRWALASVVLIYLAIVAFDIFADPKYPAWIVALLTIVGFLVGTANGFNTAFRIRFSTVMRHKTDKEMVSQIKKNGKGFGIDDED